MPARSALLFFLMHEQPTHARVRSIAEALRVVKPGGQVIFVDFAKPHWWHPLRYLWLPVLRLLEPFAPDIWRAGPETWLPPSPLIAKMERTTYFGGMYQRIVLTKV